MIETILITEKLIAIAIIFQTIEMLQIRSNFSDDGVWRWSTLQKEFKIFSRVSQAILCWCLSYKHFLTLLLIRFSCAVILLVEGNSFILLTLLISSLLVSARWRGTFNGGSDYMTTLVLFCLSIRSLYPDSEKVTLGVLLYLCVQVVSSYFIAGLVKLRKQNWWSGKALSGFITSTIYKDSSVTNFIGQNKSISLFLSWLIIFFELSFPCSLINTNISELYIACAIAFHIANFYIFGLNRFIFSWCACYPALYFCSGWLMLYR